MVTEKMIEAARDKFKELSGIQIYLPGEGTLDDFEQGRYDALVAALEAALSTDAEPVKTAPAQDENTMQSELKPCPFCGGPNVRRCEDADEFGMKSYGCQCANGDCWVVGPECGSRDEADKAWNDRMPQLKTASQLDVSNMLRHAFISGFEVMGGTITDAIVHWPEYDPESCSAYSRLLSTLYAAPPAPSVAVKALEEIKPHLLVYNLIMEAMNEGVAKATDPAWTAKDFTKSEYYNLILSALSAQVQDVAGWQSMDSAPTDGKHCLLAVRSSCFVYAVQGAFMMGKWENSADIKSEPLCWMPLTLIPQVFLPWTDEFAAAAPAAKLEEKP